MPCVPIAAFAKERVWETGISSPVELRLVIADFEEVMKILDRERILFNYIS